MALILELALQKDGDVQANIAETLNNMSKWKFRPEDATLPGYIQALVAMPDPVATVRVVVDSFFRELESQSTVQFEAEPEIEQLVEEFGNLVVADSIQHLQNIGSGRVKYNPDEVAEVHAKHDQAILGVVLRQSRKA